MTHRFRRACLVAAVIIGCVFSGIQILHDVRLPVQLLPGVAARVNGRPIDSDSVNRTVAGMDARDRRSEAAARRDVLSRMIDEELLVQHALDSGASETNPEVRAALVRSAVTRVNSEAAAEPIPEQDLAGYFTAHSEAYATPARFDVTASYFESGKPAPLPFDAPRTGVTARTLANYFGPGIAGMLAHMAPGETSTATALGHGIVTFHVNNIVPAQVPSLASVHDLVLAEAMRERQEHALETLLTSLRKSARIESFDRSETKVPPHE